jgi:hypothetical protein
VGDGGSTTTSTTTTTTTAPDYTSFFDQIIALLQTQQTDFEAQFNAGGRKFGIDYFGTGGGLTPTLLYENSKKVAAGAIQNLSTTDVLTVVTSQAPSVLAANAVAGQGVNLNPAPVSGYGGLSMSFDNIDLSQFTVITNNNNDQPLVVFYEY